MDEDYEEDDIWPSRIHPRSPSRRYVTPSPPIYARRARQYDERARPHTGELVNNVRRASPKNPQEVATSQVELLHRYRENVLKQAQQSFLWALVAALAGIFLLFATIFTFLLTRSLNVPIISGIGSIVVEAVSGLIFYLRTQSSKQLETFSESLVKTNNYMYANSLCESIVDDNVRDASRAELIRNIVRDTLSYSESQDIPLLPPTDS